MADLPKGKLEFDDPAFRRRKPHHVTPGGQVEVDVPALSQSKEIRELVELAGKIVKGDPREDLEARLQELEAEHDRLAADNQHFREREDHFARALSVADGGQYRADWEGAIRRVLSERDRLAQELEASQRREAELVSALGSVSFRCAREGCQTVHPSQLAKNDNRIERALDHPSPAAQAIGRVLEAVERAHIASCEWQENPKNDGGRAAAYSHCLGRIWKENEALRALRAGAGEGE